MSMNMVYLTVDATRKINLERRKIVFKKTASQNLETYWKNKYIGYSSLKRNDDNNL
ncbi:DUF6088 family protein [Arcicella gelida]|uniref:DUF6088 family protein n=1 Tax=Arcicella gelida TaxID=2984195 RepID=UPI003898E579